MGRLEKRLAAVELMLSEAAPWLAVGALEDAAVAIRAGLEAGPTSADEREVRLHAVQLLTHRRNVSPQGQSPPGCGVACR